MGAKKRAGAYRGGTGLSVGRVVGVGVSKAGDNFGGWVGRTGGRTGVMRLTTTALQGYVPSGCSVPTANGWDAQRQPVSQMGLWDC